MSHLDELRQRIGSAKQRSEAQPGQYFMPAGTLESILSRDDIGTALRDPAFRVPMHKHAIACEMIDRCGRAIFSLLIDLSLTAYLERLLEEDILSLPVARTTVESIFEGHTQNFVSAQWSYVPQCFEYHAYPKRLAAEAILPYTYMEGMGGGKCSKVYKIKIHPAHNHLVPETARDSYFVCKRLDTPQATATGDSEESELLFYLRELKHENIVELLTSFSQNNIPNLIFHCADSDLWKFLRQESRPPLLNDDYQIALALQGLSSGLRHFHDYRLVANGTSEPAVSSRKGCHHDLKPNNVLISGGKFVLADFGLSRLKEADEDSKTNWKNAGYDYGAPECRDPSTFRVGKIGRASDVWSMACIILEVFTYMTHGAQGVQDFKNSRRFEGQLATTFAFHNDRATSPAVDRQIELLFNSNRSGGLTMAAFMKLMLSLDPMCRPMMDSVDVQMQRLATQTAIEEVLRLAEAQASSSRGHERSSNSILLTQLHLELHRLRSWAGALGLHSNNEREDQRLRQPDSVPSFKEIFDLLSGTISSLKHPVVIHDLATQVASAHGGHPGSIVSELYQLNNRLYGFLSAHEKRSADNLFAAFATSVENADFLSSIRKEAGARADSEYEDVGLVAAMRYMALLESKQVRSAQPNIRIDPALISGDGRRDDPDTRPQTYWYHDNLGNPRKVHVERIVYGKFSFLSPNNKEFRDIGEKLFARVQSLATLLRDARKPADWRTLHCIGAYHSAERKHLGIVFDVPDQEHYLVRLHKLLPPRNNQHIPISTPDLDEKYRLAYSLAKTVACIHDSGWLHKDLNPSNIVFSHHSRDSWKDIDYKRPYVIGFDHSRQDGPDEYTEGPNDEIREEYQHPTYRRDSQRFRKSFDYYSLGLLLLSIGLWAPLENIYGKHRQASPMDLSKIYIDKCDTKLRKYVSRKFSDAVKTCLTLAMEETEEKKATMSFRTEVVNRLGGLV